MTKETLLNALGAEGLQATSDVVSIPDERDASFIVAGPGETIQVGKVIKIELRDSALCLETTKGERFWFTYDLLLGLRLTTAQTAKDRATGFGR
jgi:hypothetical protein